MSLHLSVSKLQELEDLLAVLTAPLDHDGAREWLDTVNRATVTFFEAEGAMSLLFRGEEEPRVRFHHLDPEVARTNRDIIIGGGEGTLRLSYPGLDLLLRRLAAAGVRTWTPEIAARLTGIELDGLRYTHEVAIPGGIYHQANMAIPLPVGVAQISFFHSSPDDDPFGDDRLTLLRLLLPAFRAGVVALRSFERTRGALVDQFAASSTSILVFDRSGRLLYRNGSAEALLEGEDSTKLEAEAARLAVRVTEIREPPRKSGSGPPRLLDEPVIQTEAEQYRLSTTFVPAGIFHRDGVGVVRVERLTPAVPSPGMIQRRLGLTPRQAEVACLIAQGHTSAELAEELGISIHTARRHTEAVLSRLELRSRSGVAARLMSLTPPA